MSASGFRLNVSPIRHYINAKEETDALYQRREIAQAIRKRKGDISLGKSLQMADEILDSNLYKAQNNDFKFKLTSKMGPV